ncbi:MAG: HAMP domain-containing sensor histidine kinase [Candidatus Saccharibacteria bacterium]|nr:HAMP domain-containing sensor histidine kinase [Candidatus Saccharibacteria bacterium]
MGIFRKSKRAEGVLEEVDHIETQLNSVNSQSSQSVTEELYRKNVELAHTNKTLSLLQTIDGLVLEQKNSLNDLAEGIASALIGNSSYIIGSIFLTDSRYDSPLSVKGLSFSPLSEVSEETTNLLKQVTIKNNSDWINGKGISLTFDLDYGDNQNLLDFFDGDTTKYIDVIKNIGIKSIIVYKLKTRERLVGILFIGSSEQSTSINIEEFEHLSRVSEATGIAIDNKLLFEEYQSVLLKLKHSNNKLKALDEAKDEFVSMASHQLRTPLTSIKGYISMVLDGDAGDINPTQKQMLGQALFSSQRMVYLISDLLNVSRLKTGKFVIEARPVYLPDLVESEISQLYEGATAKNITFSFDKPSNFPKLNLDDMKLRQVIMNFSDNAIYYTPSGGKITVSLKDKKDSVEFTVKDSGIGVPKAEQHKLFAKFYRAENARKARPDGTGLGLFMAKKVIIAQGGSLIFDSKEGKGSTFGFSFPKSRLEIKPDETKSE